VGKRKSGGKRHVWFSALMILRWHCCIVAFVTLLHLALGIGTGIANGNRDGSIGVSYGWSEYRSRLIFDTSNEHKDSIRAVKRKTGRFEIL
jgi:hypothetical protein